MSKDEITKRIALFREVMRDTGIKAAIIRHTDPHQSEYIADHWQIRRYLSGFTGSAGDLVITVDKAALWVDSRYYLQGERQLAATDISLMKIGQPGTPTIVEYIIENVDAGGTVGIDGSLFSIRDAQKLEKSLAEAGIRLDVMFDPIDSVWKDRPALPAGQLFVYDIKYAGESAASKIEEALSRVHEGGAAALMISALDEVAWILNIRCDDVKYNPVFISYLYLSEDKKVLFIDKRKVSDAVAAYLSENGVEIRGYGELIGYLGRLPDDLKVMVDEATTSSSVGHLLDWRAVYSGSVVAVSKACRNSVELSGLRNSMIKDGVALVKSFRQLEQMLAAGEPVTEMDFGRIMYRHRSEQPLFFDESFGAIVGYGAHGAIVHYEAEEDTDVRIEDGGLLLVDSGGQYLDGTTDITRTISIGEPSQEARHDFTIVMQGHIALAKMVYPAGTRGSQLDVEARKFLWREGKGFLHGTGHGVGHFLNVHEGPQGIRLNDLPTPLMEGMVTSNEPGLYVDGKYGIRCENLLLTVKAFTTDFGDFLKFETLTLYPFDLALFETEIMSDEEIEWVNRYHETVYEKLAPHLSDDEREWLKGKTEKLTR